MRYDWLKKTDSISDGFDNVTIDVFDTLNIDWSTFQFTTSKLKYIITKADREKPWMISSKLFGNNYIYEDLIFLINGIKNPMDLIVGSVINVPSIEDIKSFINSIKQ